jgi:hypothetical protein
MEDLYTDRKAAGFILMAKQKYRHPYNTKGMALVMALITVTVSAGLLAVVMYFAMSGSEISGLQRKYQSSKEASLGAVDILTKEFIQRVIAGQNIGGQRAIDILGSFTWGTNSALVNTTNQCFYRKLTVSTATWIADGCGTANDTNPANSPDVTFNLLSADNRSYQIRTKIIDTVTGNSNMSGVILEGLGVTESGSGLITVKHNPYLYTIATQGQLPNSTTERANLEVLYAY